MKAVPGRRGSGATAERGALVLTYLFLALADAAESSGYVPAIIGAATAMLVASVPLVIMIIDKFKAWRQSERAGTLREYAELNALLLAENRSLKEEAARRIVADLAGRREAAELRGYIVAYYGTLQRWHGLISRLIGVTEKAGIIVEGLPEMPPSPPDSPQRVAAAEADFVMRQHEQASREIGSRSDDLIRKLPARKES